MRDRRRLTIVVVAVAFLLAAYLLSRWSDSAEDTAQGVTAGKDDFKKERVVFPRDQGPRKKPGPRPQGALDTERAPADRPPPGQDPLQSALARPGGKGALFVEVNAIRHSELVEKMLKCRQDDAFQQLNEMKDELGIDPAEDLDRVGFDDKVLAASGFFKDLKLPAELGEGTTYGDKARIYQLPKGEEADDKGGYMARVGDDMMLMGETEDDVRQAVDRVEGRSPTAAQMPEPLTRSEIYGTVGKEFIQGLLKDADDPVAQRMSELVNSGSVRMNIDEHVALSMDMNAVDEQSGNDLAKAVGGALAAMRTDATKQGEDEMAWLLEQARVQPGADGKFAIDVAVPGEFILNTMGCDKDGNPKPGARPKAPPAPAPPVVTPPPATP